ncbi:MAG: energy transducer TonB, partial [Vulcanimicrobiaceae bacterium]
SRHWRRLFHVSILLHLLATPLFPNLVQHHEDDQVEKMAVVKKPTIVHTPPPTPPPTPQPQKQQPQKQQQHSQPQLKVQPPKSTNSGSGAPSESKYVPPASGNENGAPSGGGTGPPGPPATAKPSCPDPSREATASNIVQPEYPDSARDLGLGTVTVLVEVTIGPTGALEEAKISQSSGNMAIDQSALRAARQSTYTPQLADCAPTTGSYIFHAEFSPDN